MNGILGSGSEDLTPKKKATGHGLMEASGASPTGPINLASNQTVAYFRTVSRYIIAINPTMDGVTKTVIQDIGLSAAGEFAQVWTKRQINLTELLQKHSQPTPLFHRAQLKPLVTTLLSLQRTPPPKCLTLLV